MNDGEHGDKVVHVGHDLSRQFLKNKTNHLKQNFLHFFDRLIKTRPAPQNRVRH